MNITEIGQSLIGVTNQEGLKIVGELFLFPVLCAWFITILITVIIALKTIHKGWSNFFVIFILPNILFLVLILFIFIIPVFPEWFAGAMEGWLSG